MKRIILLSISMCLLLAVQSCKEEEAPTPTPTPETDLRDQLVGEFNTALTVYNASTGEKKKTYSILLKVQKNSKDATKTDFYLDGLYLFMTATNLRTISVGRAMDFAEQEVKDFGTLKGKSYINVNGDTKKYMGIHYDGTGKMTIYLEKDNPGTADDDLYEFYLTKK